MSNRFGLTPYKRGNMTDYFDDFERAFFGGFPEFTAMRTDIEDCGDAYKLSAELPGFKKEDISIDTEGDLLTISASHDEKKEEKKEGGYIRRERVSGSYRRSFDISNVDAENISAKYDGGVLELMLPKRMQSLPSGRRIEIS